MTGALYFVSGALLTLLLLILRERFAGFSAQRPEDYDGASPDFDLQKHLNGPIDCEGVIFGPTGRVVSRFSAKMDAHWNGGLGVMRERFLYDSGSRQDREWRLEMGDDGAFRAEADDLIGAGHGRQAGPSAWLRYRIRLPREAGGHVLDVNDWMYLLPNGVIVNRSRFSKFGIRVAELVATMRRTEAEG